MNSAVSGAIARVKNLPDSRLGGLIRSRLSAGKGGKKKWILLAAAAVLAVIAAVGIYRLFFAQEKQVPVTATTTFGSLNETIEGSATTTPADSVTYEISGTVLEWNVEAGQEVKAGDLLYVLDSSDAEDEILEYEVNLEDLYEQRADIQESIANQRVTAPFSGRIENIQVEAGDDVQSGMTLATLVDDSAMKATLYFSYAYEDQMYVGMPATLSVPDQMLTVDGTVTDIRYVDYVTAEGMKCFAVTVEAENPGSLAEGMTATCWAQDSSGAYLYAVNDAELEYKRSATLTAETSGELTAMNAVDYQQVSAGKTLFTIDASGYETQLETVDKQIENHEKNIADLQDEIDNEYTRRADIDGTVVSADYATDRMTGKDTGSVVIYNQESMEISINVDELDVDYLEVGMPVTVYRSTSSGTVYYDGELTYLSLEATSGSSGVSTFAATVTITPQEGQDFDLSSGVTVYYSIDTGGSGFVYDLEGNRGAASGDFSAIDWTDTISSGSISYYRTNSAGQVDLILLKSVTGGCYDYGKLTRYTGSDGISAGSMDGETVYNDAATLTNAGGTSQKYLYTMSYTNRYVGVALGQSAAGGTRIAAVQTLTSAKADAEDFFLQDGDWYVESGRQEYRVSDRVQIHLTEADLWLEGAEGLASVLADGYTLTLYYDRSADEGGQVRLITAQ